MKNAIDTNCQCPVTKNSLPVHVRLFGYFRDVESDNLFHLENCDAVIVDTQEGLYVSTFYFSEYGTNKLFAEITALQSTEDSVIKSN